jgi:hypothetical protein
VPDKARFAPGGARPAPATVYAAPRSELFPGVERQVIVLWLGVALIAANEAVDGGPIASAIRAATGQPLKSQSGGVIELAIEVVLVGFLYVMALASDEAGTLAILIVLALWAAWLVRHVGAVQGFFSAAASGLHGAGTLSSTPVSGGTPVAGK